MDESISNDKTMMSGGVSKRFALKTGSSLGQYRILEPLGKGGMGEVYLVEHQILRTRHALKLLPADRAGSAGFLDRFRDEARVMANLQHSGIVHVQYAGVDDGHHYLVMDFVDAGDGQPFDLEDALANAPEGRFDPETVARLAIGICEAVGHAHKQGVVHRDLKPANVLLTSRNLNKAEVRVGDFGLARLVGEDWLRSVVDASMRQSIQLRQGYDGQVSIGGMKTDAVPRSERSSTGSILGTYEYMSPEQREGSDADERSDIFALGVMLYRMLTGKRLVGRAKAASKLVDGLSAGWDELIDTCLEEAPSDRHDNMAMVVESMQELLVNAVAETERLQREASEAEQRQQAAEAERQKQELEEAQRVHRAKEALLAAEHIRHEREEHERQREETELRKIRAAEEKAVRERDRLDAEKADRRRKRRRALKRFVLLAIIAGIAWAGWSLYEGNQLKSRKRTPSPARTVRPQSKPAVPAPITSRRPRSIGGTSRTLKAGDTQSIDLGGGVKLEMVWCPAGEFMMGSPLSEKDRGSDEVQHRVKLSKGFWLGKYEVTQEQWERVRGSNPSQFKGSRNPAEKVSWNDCQDFIRELNGRVSGGRFRLPTESEWEYACRAGTSTPFCYGSRLDSSMANFDGDYPYGGASKGVDRNKTVTVGSFRPNAWGLYDMHGNVWEWCSDWYGAYPSGSATDSAGPGSGSDRVYRGGSWLYYARSCRSANRYWYSPVYRISFLGLRLAMDQSP